MSEFQIIKRGASQPMTWLRRLIPGPGRAHNAAQVRGPKRKLPPISEVLERAGREPLPPK